VVLGFVAAFSGGLWEQIASYTPAEMLQTFRRGLVRLDLVLAALTVIEGSLLLAAVLMRLGIPLGRKMAESFVIVSLTGILAFAATFARPSWDVSENERNSFPGRHSALLSKITAPLRIEAYLAPEDPPRFDLEQQTFPSSDAQCLM
jgi:small-conductance mechanosensitive channel